MKFFRDIFLVYVLIFYSTQAFSILMPKKPVVKLAIASFSSFRSGENGVLEESGWQGFEVVKVFSNQYFLSLNSFYLDTPQISSGVLKVKKKFYSIQGLFGHAFSFHDRKRFSLGLGYFLEQTKQEILGKKSEDFSGSFQLLSQYNFDYAVSPSFELGFMCSCAYDFSHQDFLGNMAFSFGYNLA